MSGEARPLDLILARHAEADLLRIEEAPRQRVKADVLRLAKGQIPLGQSKKLRSFTPPLWQLTSGRFRIMYRREAEQLLILRVVTKPEQRDLFRSLRR